ncbi:bifunctional 5'-3' exoribonuclease type 2/putative 5-3 exonuclease/Xrn1 [Babesia duncani]|uniref:5'-3' exoribonuclease n=1 Tax=Babesia duncani TaxID=323732 RepID=A0AAD9PP23_9APIC|nr:bifunctional 5'-3' exoribonuclease type 2/putative 5-3 exonuclease/Xrn1 [Babesia duncani]
MGVPTFYRWLCNRYPRVVRDVYDKINENNLDFNNTDAIGADLLSPNPNGEFDNLYLDMNGIIHPCCHPENMVCSQFPQFYHMQEQPESEEVMYESIFLYIDRIFYLVRPRRLIFLAIDGVAPRAKMNQQRSRRFKSAAEADLDDETYERVAAEFKQQNMAIPERRKKWDSNVITPGTEFMYELSRRLVDYIKNRIATYDAWKRITVIFSDANVAGEGEHKIMNFIRNQRHHQEYNPNMRHVLHGMDADLIMLGLATHEVNFFIIREIVTDSVHKKVEDNIRKEIEQATAATGTALKNDQSYISKLRQNWKPLQFLQLAVLREYLSHQLQFPTGWRVYSKHRRIEFERCVDDVVLMCFFCGNDFLPHLPSISIPGGSIDQMIFLYQQILPDLGDYLCNEGELNLAQLDVFVEYLSRVEHDVFNHAYQRKQNNKRRCIENSQLQTNNNSNGGALDPLNEFKRRQQELLKEHCQIEDPKEPIDLSLQDPKQYKSAYYCEKFQLDPEENVEAFAATVANHYVTGMSWVLRYYYQGCASWCWYYPYHFAPFCSDLKFKSASIHLEPGEPFTPFQQLLSVMPSRSSHCLPKELRFLMHESDSPLIDFYPKKFKEDPNGKRHRWQWVALLPFIDEALLLKIVKPLESKLSEADQKRNAKGTNYLVVPGIRQLERLVGKAVMMQDHHEFSSFSEHKHRCALLPGAIIPPPILRMEDLMDDSRNRGFNAEVAKRMISQALGGSLRHNNNVPIAPNRQDFHQHHNAYNANSYSGSMRQQGVLSNNIRFGQSANYMGGQRISRPPWLDKKSIPPPPPIKQTHQYHQSSSYNSGNSSNKRNRSDY